MSVRLIWLQRAGMAVLFVLLVLLAREAATHSIDFPVYHRAARNVIAGHYELYPAEAYRWNAGSISRVPLCAGHRIPVRSVWMAAAGARGSRVLRAEACGVCGTSARRLPAMLGLSESGGKCSSSHS